MSRTKIKRKQTLARKYPPSQPCACVVCLAYCARPGWWTVAEATAALHAGYGNRMMLEISQDRSLGVLSPAFNGCEGTFALQDCANRGCNFLQGNRCELHGTGFQPLECGYCHHDRPGLGPRCHADIGKDWNSRAGRALVATWSKLTGIWEQLSLYGLERLKT